jgi:hypothetical protein
MPSPPTIPKSVRNLLGYRWREGDNTFERVFRSDPDRQPSNYHIRTGQMVETDADTLSHAEVKALVEEGVFGHLAAVHPRGVSINKHAQHALTDFLGEVYGAWRIYQERLAEIARASPPVQ